MISVRDKGKRGEREVVKILREAFGEDANIRRSSALQADGGGEDILAPSLWPLVIEVKRAEKLQLGPWWDQACRQAEDVGGEPVLWYRANRQPWRVRMRLQILEGVHVVADMSAEEGLKAMKAVIKHYHGGIAAFAPVDDGTAARDV